MRAPWWAWALLPVGLFATVYIIGMFVMWPVPMTCAALVVIPASVGVLVLRSHRRAQRAVIARAEYEHAALLRGEMGLGVYGRFQPPRI